MVHKYKHRLGQVNCAYQTAYGSQRLLSRLLIDDDAICTDQLVPFSSRKVHSYRKRPYANHQSDFLKNSQVEEILNMHVKVYELPNITPPPLLHHSHVPCLGQMETLSL